MEKGNLDANAQSLITEAELYKAIVEKAVSFGMIPMNDSKKTSDINEGNKNFNAVIRHNTSIDSGQYFGFISKDEGVNKGKDATSGPYSGLSFIVFPDNVEGEVVKHCVFAITIGSATLGEDTALATSPGFRRSFMSLTNIDNADNADNAKKAEPKFFFAENWGDMETRTPMLEETLRNEGVDEKLINAIKKYDNGSHGKGLLPAACLINIDNIKIGKDNDGKINTDSISEFKILYAWLAQYAKWRGWVKQDQRKAIDKSLKEARTKPKSNDELKKEIAECLMGLDEVVFQGEGQKKEEKGEEQKGKGEESKGHKKYIVLEGAPGCGKTRMALDIAKTYFEKEKEKENKDKTDNIFFTQFHAETTYADFVYGIKPTLSGTSVAYEGERGILLKAIKKAEEVGPDVKVLLIIDEINRANLANVLGPVFYLFEPNAKDHNYSLTLGKEKKKDKDGNEKIVDIIYKKLPDNLYVIATMNTADRSLAVVDFALRRRFAWYTLYPKSLAGDDLKVSGGQQKYFDEKRFNEFCDIFNKYATDDELHLQPGHSYFIVDQKSDGDDEPNEEMKFRLKYELMPLIKEYLNEGYLLPAREEFSHLFYKYTKEYMYK